MDFAKRVLRFDGPGTADYAPVPNPHDDDALASDEFEREYLFGAPRPGNDEDVDSLLNESDWLGLRGGGATKGNILPIVALDLLTLSSGGTLLWWLIREVAEFKDSMYDLSLCGVSIIGAICVITLTSLICLVIKAFRFVEIAHWASLVMMPWLVLYLLAMCYMWEDSLHYETMTDDGGDTYTKVIVGLTKPWLVGLLSTQLALLVMTLVADLAVPYEDARKTKAFYGTLFTSALILVVGAVVVAVFAGLSLDKVPLLRTEIEGWSAWTAAFAAIGVAVVSISGLACSRKALTAILYVMPVMAIPMLVASVFNFSLATKVPISDSETGTSLQLTYSSVIAFCIMPFAALSWGTAVMWRRRIKSGNGWPH